MGFRVPHLLVEGLGKALEGEDAQRVFGDSAEALGALLRGKPTRIVQRFVGER